MHLEIDGRIKWVNTCIQQEGLAFCRYYISESCSVVSDSLRPHRLYSPWNSPGQNTGVGSCSLLQGIFPTQGLNPGLLHSRWILDHLSHEGSPRKLEWVAYPFSRIFPPKELNKDLLHTGEFFISWVTRETHKYEISVSMRKDRGYHRE